MFRFFKWLFSKKQENERRQSNNKLENTLHDCILFVLFFVAAILITSGLSRIHNDNNQFSVPIFILVVSLIARFTRGYLYGVAASVLGVLCVNYMFTYPYWEFDMSITGYPLTFLSMLMVSLCISTLTTQIKKQEQLRRDAEMESMRANLLRSVSHDLRTPLTSIVGSSSVLLEDDALSDEQKNDLLLEINKDARWLTRITENLLSVTKFSSDGVKLHKDIEVVEEIVSSAIVKFRKSSESIRVFVHKPEEILLAPMDATLIEQVIINLFDNSATHGKHTSRIDVNIFEKNHHMYIAVEDDGAGISPSVFPHLFDGHASSFSKRSDDQRNMGIGLSVCRSIVRAHGGEIRAYNNTRGGAGFEFWLPSSKEKTNEHS